MAKKVIKKVNDKEKEGIADDRTVFIGVKDELVYVRACLYILKRYNQCAIKARYSKFMTAINVYYEVMTWVEDKVSVVPSFWKTPFTTKDGRKKESKEMMILLVKNGKVERMTNGNSVEK
jgi:DNA-binding protein